MDKEIKKIKERIEELNKRMEELEEINQRLISEGKQSEFDGKYGIEYENISDELYMQRRKLQKLEKNN
ncbi:MAG: hypothetical protein ACOCV8_01650 [Spirochaetota bacterium]